MLASGMQLGPYKIRAPLGAGGMGEVYRAKDSRLDRDVAIKVLSTQFAQDPARLARFEREAKVVAALSHPNILAIHDYGTEQGHTFAVMELLEGETLRGRIALGAIPWRKAVGIAAAIADGLSAAHAKGIIHRDLKPENIFLIENDWVKVLDFGLARIEPLVAPSGDTPTGTFQAAPTEVGAILGTVGYMSPEQVRAQGVDVRSDVFSLGCVLFEMVHGQRAFARPSAVETLAAILHDEPPELADSGQNVPLELSRLIQHCLEKNREARCQSARNVAFALRAMLIDSNTSGPRAITAGEIRKPVILWLLTACALLGVAATSAFLAMPWFRNEAAITAASKPEPALESLAIVPLDKGIGGPQEQGIQSVAVLPLENLGGDPKTEFLSDGLADQIINSLSQVRRQNLKVRPFSSVSRYKGQKPDVQTIARELNVQAIVTGSLHQQGDDLSIGVELVDAREDNRLWGQRYQGKLSGILDLQDQIARDVAANLHLQLTGAEEKQLTKRHTEDSGAYLLYREGVFHLNKFTPEGLQTGIEYFQRALKMDPNYALALVGVARSRVLLGTLHIGPKATQAEARELLSRALMIDSTVADARAGLGAIHMFHDWDWPAAERELKQAVATEISSPMTWPIYGFYLAAQGRLPEALESIKRGQQIDPLAAPRRHELAMCYVWLRQYDEAIAEAKKALELDPNFLNAYIELAKALTQKGMYEEAIAELRKAPNFLQGTPSFLGQLGYAYAMAGQGAEAEKVVRELKDPIRFRYGCAFAIATIHAALGEKDQAFEWLQKACEERHSRVIWLKVDPMLDSLRSDPRFDEILQEMGLVEKAATQKDQPIDTLAVLPFDNQSADAEAGYLGDDITYSLTDSLARVRELKVRPYSSAARFKTGSFDAKTAGRELQVQAVLRGSIQKRGVEVLIYVELIHVGDDRRLWGNRYLGKLADRLKLQQQIIQEVPEKLLLTLTGQEKQMLAKLPTPSLKAHELYILGRLEWNKRTVQGLEKSMNHYRLAIDQDPNYALAWASLAEAYFVFPINTDSPPKDSMLKAKAAATRALEIDDQLVEAHTVLAAIAGAYEWDWSEAERKFQRALALNPNNATARYRYGQLLTTLGRFDEAQVHSQRARELDPLSLIVRAVTGRHFYYARQYEKAIEQYQKAFDVDPSFWVAHLFLGHAYAQQGLYEEAVAELQRVRQFPGANLEALASLGQLYAVMGKTGEAQKVLDELKELSEQRYVPAYYFAIIHAAQGEKEQALAGLDKAYEDRNFFIALLRVEPMLDSLRNEPRFQKIVADMKFPE